MMKVISSLYKSLLTYRDKKIISIFLLGFSSGLPFYLILSTLIIWLKESGVNNTTVGLFASVTLPYPLKFLWGPLVDRVHIPLISSWLGIRRSWMLLAQLAVSFNLFHLSQSDPIQHIWMTAFWAFLVALSSAVQDIVIEAYRIEIIDANQSGAAASASSLGYRFGMLASGAGALYLAEATSWHFAFTVMACCQFIGIITTLLSPAPKSWVASAYPHLQLKSMKTHPLHIKFFHWLKQAFLPPLRDLIHNNNWQVILAFIVFYKVGDTALNAMSAPFLVETGFSKYEIANVAKLFGISAMIFGGFVAGILLNRFGILTNLMLCAFLQIVSSLIFTIQAVVGYNLEILTITMGIESFTSGFGAASFIAYLSSMCSAPNTATHFALLSSFGSLARVILTSISGKLADLLPWDIFFLLIAFCCLPSLLLLVYSADHFPSSPMTNDMKDLEEEK